MSITKVAIQFTAIDLMSRGISRMRQKIRSLSSASEEVQHSFDKMTGRFKLAGMIGVTTSSIARGISPAIKNAASLQEELLGVKAELASSVKSAKDMETALDKVNKTAFLGQAQTPFDQSQFVALERQLLKSGASIEAVTGRTGAAVAAANLAIQEGLEPVEAGKALIGLAGPFKIAADGYFNLADAIARAAGISPVGAREITEAASESAHALSTVGRSSDEMLVLISMMAKMGIVGSRAGTALKNFFLGASKYKDLRDSNGDLKKTSELIEIIRKRTEGMGSAEKAEFLSKRFGEEAGPAIVALLDEGANSYKNMTTAMQSATGLQEKMNTRMQGFNKQLESLKGTSKSIISDLFQPALSPLTTILDKTNAVVSKFGEFAQGNKTISELVSNLGLGTVALGEMATAGLGIGGLLAGRKVLKGIGGFKGLFGDITNTALGVAKGKAIEAATGIQPVFVTNWPVGGITGIPSENATDIKEKFNSLWDGLKGGATEGVGAISGGGLLSAIKNFAFMPVASAKGGTIGLVGAGGLAAGHFLGKALEKVDFIREGLDKLFGVHVPALVGLPERFKNRKAVFSQPHESAKTLAQSKANKLIRETVTKNTQHTVPIKQPDIKNQIDININIDKNERVVTTSNNMNTKVKTQVNRGSF